MRKFIVSLLAIAVLALPAAGKTPKKVKTNENGNPFLTEYPNKYKIPPFEKIKYEHYLPALEQGIAQHNEEIKMIAEARQTPTFQNTVLALDNSGEVYNKVCAVFVALNESDATPEMQEIAEKFMPMMTAHNDEIYMNEGLFSRIKMVYNNADQMGLDPVQKRLVEKYYKKFVRKGALLNPEQKEELMKINQREAELELAFGKNVMREMSENVIYVTDKSQLSGLSQEVIDGAAELAKERGHQGWGFTASAATRLAVLNDADSRDLREKMYKMYTSTASHGDEWDNSENINKILKLRTRKANLLGFETYADYACDAVMAKTVENAEDLLMQIWWPAIKKVDEEVADMQKYADAHGANYKLEPWDYYYFANKVKAERYSFSEDEIRPYFELNSVVKNGIFYAANKLYGITFTEMKDAPKYNPEVTVYDVKDAQGKHLAVFMTDYFPRATKAQGAWMNEMNQSYNYNGVVERPIIYNVGSFNPPTKETPSLLSIDQVETVFHEFGHALHGMLTQVAYRGLEGTNVDRDMVELPSQINEHWMLVPEVLKNYAKHYKTGEVIPQALVDKLIESSKFNQGFMTTELVGAALLDIEWHKLNWCDDIDVKAFERSVAKRLRKPAIIEYRYRSPYFKHIFNSEEYSCGYYTYLWAQVLEADGWERFQEEGPMNLNVANDYRKYILEAGDIEDAMTLYKKFRGREPDAKALLRLRGLE
ncbi:MAG: M3 family metallopeptidase [Muribaculaceae bacterium]|nr:M3 family metallopeptidase [Muribaculaceae bacterium]